jgi:hypothetical protein
LEFAGIKITLQNKLASRSIEAASRGTVLYPGIICCQAERIFEEVDLHLLPGSDCFFDFNLKELRIKRLPFLLKPLKKIRAYTIPDGMPIIVLKNCTFFFNPTTANVPIKNTYLKG